MALDFPSNPNLNDTYTLGTRSWTWNGSAWRLSSPTLGFTGSQGDIGYTGSASTVQGPMGYTGSQGIDGVIGRDGYTGSMGYTGSAGPQGVQGYAGSAGGTAITAFKSRPTATQQSLTSGAYTKVNLGTEDYDTSNFYDPVTGRFQPTVPGYYHIDGTTYVSGSGITWAETHIRVSGVTASVGGGALSSSAAGMSQTSVDVYLNGTTDYVEMFVYAAGSNLKIHSSIDLTQFSGHLLTASGYVGSQGVIGFTGSQGPAGGYTGSQGDTGYVGSQGALGYTGSQGVGFTGSQGEKGYTGSAGGATPVITRMYATAASQLLASTWVKMSIGGVGIDTDNFAVPASSRFQPQHAGYYYVHGSVASTSGSYWIVAAIYKNGAMAAQGNAMAGSVSNVSDTIYMNGTTDYLELYGYSGGTVNSAVGANATFLIASLVSASGYTGSKGDVGPQGPAGGYTGSQGVTGYVGSQGVTGYTGSFGYTGSQGDRGYTGSIGYTGSQGVTGYTGSFGYTGSIGYVGSIGYTGSMGQVVTYFQEAPPVSPNVSDIWIDSTTGIQYVYMSDGNTSQWVELANSGIAGYTGSKGDSATTVSKYNITGPIVLTTGTLRWYPHDTITIDKIYFSVGTPGTGLTQIDVKKNNASVFVATQPPSVNTDVYRSNDVTMAYPVLSTDFITIDVISAGTGAADAVVYIVYH